MADQVAEISEAEARNRVDVALRTLQREYEDEGCHTLASQLGNIMGLPAETRARLYDLITSNETADAAAEELASELQDA